MRKLIKSVINIDNNEMLDTFSLFYSTEEFLFQLKSNIHKRYISSNKKETGFICASCRQPVLIKGNLKPPTLMHFSHLKNSGYCSYRSIEYFPEDDMVIFELPN